MSDRDKVIAFLEKEGFKVLSGMYCMRYYRRTKGLVEGGGKGRPAESHVILMDGTPLKGERIEGTVLFEIHGKSGGVGLQLQVHSIAMSDVLAKFEDIQLSLLAAWTAFSVRIKGKKVEETPNEYNGHKSYEHWNISAIIANDEWLYNLAREYVQRLGVSEETAERFIEELADNGVTKTLDGVEYTVERVWAALEEYEEE